jgi:hypothetical protein
MARSSNPAWDLLLFPSIHIGIYKPLSSLGNLSYSSRTASSMMDSAASSQILAPHELHMPIGTTAEQVKYPLLVH